MAEFQEVMRQFNRMCSYYQREHECPIGCPMSGVNISQCRKIAVECPDSVERTVMSWAAEHPEPVYPTWEKYLADLMMLDMMCDETDNPNSVENYMRKTPIPADIAKKLGIEPKEG